MSTLGSKIQAIENKVTDTAGAIYSSIAKIKELNETFEDANSTLENVRMQTGRMRTYFDSLQRDTEAITSQLQEVKPELEELQD